jgi:5'-3' exonuclease
MGIPSYFSYIVKNHSEIIKKYETGIFPISNFYLDCNSIIYDCYAKLDPSILNEETGTQIINNVILKIEEYISLIQPTNNIIIAFDGVAPVAKLKQQRERRYKSWYQSSIINTIKQNSSLGQVWDKTAITPGTIFMNELNQRISVHFNVPKKEESDDTDTPTPVPINIIVSGSNIVGEGEHKIFQYIRDNPEKHSDGMNTFIYGLDSDLIMLGMNHLHCCPNIYLFRETPHFIQSINSELEPNANYYLDIPELSNNISCYMTDNNCNKQINRMHDYILLCFLLGNDFLPHFPAINIRTGGINKLLSAYKISLGNHDMLLTNGSTIYWQNFKKLIKVLSELEENYFIDEHILRNKMENKQKYLKWTIHDTIEDKKNAEIEYFNSTPINYRHNERYINPLRDKWQNRYYKELFVNESNPYYDKRCISINYLQGLEWTMKYYTTGNIDWTWKYEYNYPPLLEDLYKYIPSRSTQFITEVNSCKMPELAQLCYVLPIYNFHLIPKRLADTLIHEFPEWYQEFADQGSDNNFIWAYCRYFWEAHLIAPDLDIDRFIQVVKESTSQE